MISNASEPITNNEDYIDSRDMEARIIWLQSGTRKILLTEEEREELEELLRLRREEIDEDDWKYGVTFIKDDYFVEYTQEFFEEIGAVNSAYDIINNNINWAAVAEELTQDYYQIIIFDTLYWYREA